MKIYIRFMFNSKQYRIQRFSKVALSGSSILFLLEILKFGWLVPTLPGIFLKIWFLLYLASTWRSCSNFTWHLLEDLVPTIPGSYLKIWFQLYLAATWISGSYYTWQLLEDLVPTIPGSYLKIWFYYTWQLLEDLVPTLPGRYLKIWFQLYLAATWRSGSNYTWQLLEDLIYN